MGEHEEKAGKYARKRQYNKLVRDKIPEYLEKKGAAYRMHIATDLEYWQKLKDKLKEEAEEFADEPDQDVLADMLEVIDAICEYRHINSDELALLRRKKATERGLFKKRIILEES